MEVKGKRGNEKMSKTPMCRPRGNAGKREGGRQAMAWKVFPLSDVLGQNTCIILSSRECGPEVTVTSALIYIDKDTKGTSVLLLGK